MEDAKEPLTEEQQLVELGILVGQRRAFGMVAGRCSAAQADCLRKIRDERLYLKFAPNWAEYCVRHLKIPKRTADHVIALLKKHGVLYYETAALTGISPAQFDCIRDAIRQDGIHSGGEVIALIPENSARAIEAVARLQAEAAADGARRSASAMEKIEELERRGKRLYEGFHKTAEIADGFERSTLIGAIKRIQQLFGRLEVEIR